MVYITKAFWFSVTLSKDNGAQNTLQLTNNLWDFWRMQKEKYLSYLLEKNLCCNLMKPDYSYKELTRNKINSSAL